MSYFSTTQVFLATSIPSNNTYLSHYLSPAVHSALLLMKQTSYYHSAVQSPCVVLVRMWPVLHCLWRIL